MRYILQRVVICIAMLLLVVTAGCGSNPESTQSSVQGGLSKELYISAAASLTDAMKEIGSQYEASHPGIKLIYSFGSSGALQTQIEQGAPADVFVSAAQKQMEALDQQGLILSDTKKALLLNKVVLIVPKDSALQLADFAALTDKKVQKIALGEPKAVPVGQYAEDIFMHLGISDAVRPKAVYASDVRQVLAWVETGEVDCGIVYATDAAISDKVRVLLEAPAGSHKPVIYPVAVLKASKQADAAKDFTAYLASDEAKTIFTKYGFEMK